MSSHHIVRDKQEPALLIANGEACSLHLLGQLLEWSPFVLALDGAIHRLIELGIKVDAVLGDGDSRMGQDEELLQLQPDLKILHRPDQELTDLEKGLHYLLEEGHKAVNIVWATGRRADHTLANITNLAKFQESLVINMLDDYSRIYLLPKHFRKWYPGGTTLSLMPISRVDGVVTHNLQFPLKDEFLEPGLRIGSSNKVVTDGWVEIQYRSGSLLMMECQD